MSAVAVAVAPAAAADPAQTEHNNVHRMVQIFQEGEGMVVPCVGEGELTLTFNGNQRLTTNDNAFHEGTMFTGTFVASLEDGTSAGRATLMSTGNYTAKHASFTEIFTGKVTSGAREGTSWSWTVHFSGPVDEDGNPIIEQANVYWDTLRCF